MSTLRIYRGDTLPRTFTLTDFDGAALNLTGASATFSVKTDVGAGSYIFQKTGTQGGASSGITFPSPTLGKLTVEIVPADTQSVTPGNYVWDLQVTLASGRVHTFPRDSSGDPVTIVPTGSNGVFVVYSEVTRP